jgi:hypothetical protein
MKKLVDDSVGPLSPAAGKKTENSVESRGQGEMKKQKEEALRRCMQERLLYDNMVVKAGLLKRIKNIHLRKSFETLSKNMSTRTP